MRRNVRPPHKWLLLRGAAKLWSASAVRFLSGLGDPWVIIRAQYNAPVAMGMTEAMDHIVAVSSQRRSLYQENCCQLHKVMDKIESERLFGNSGPRARGPDWVSAASWVRNVFDGITCILACYGHCVWSGLRNLETLRLRT